MSRVRLTGEPRVGIRGFTLIEMLVAVAVLALLVVMIAEIISLSSKALAANTQKLDGVGEIRSALDRLEFDLASRLRRVDVPTEFTKHDGNDSIKFFSEVEGYGGGRHISLIGYRIREDLAGRKYQLERASPAMDWGTTKGVDFGSNLTPALNDSDYDVFGAGVLRLEFSFLMQDGSVVNAIPSDPKKVTGYIVAVAVIDSNTRKILTDDQLKIMSDFLPDPKDGEDPVSAWQEAFESHFPADLPLPARHGLRFSQRFYYVR